jgi:hypothetical protein
MARHTVSPGMHVNARDCLMVTPATASDVYADDQSCSTSRRQLVVKVARNTGRPDGAVISLDTMDASLYRADQIQNRNDWTWNEISRFDQSSGSAPRGGRLDTGQVGREGVADSHRACRSRFATWTLTRMRSVSMSPRHPLRQNGSKSRDTPLSPGGANHRHSS